MKKIKNLIGAALVAFALIAPTSGLMAQESKKKYDFFIPDKRVVFMVGPVSGKNWDYHGRMNSNPDELFYGCQMELRVIKDVIFLAGNMFAREYWREENEYNSKIWSGPTGSLGLGFELPYTSSQYFAGTGVIVSAKIASMNNRETKKNEYPYGISYGMKLQVNLIKLMENHSLSIFFTGTYDCLTQDNHIPNSSPTATLTGGLLIRIHKDEE